MTVPSVPSSSDPHVMPAPSARPRPGRSGLAVASIVTLTMAVAACSDDGGSKVSAFCATAQANADGLVGNITDAKERADTIARFTELEKQAPKVIQDDLATMLGIFEALGKLDLTNPEQRNEAFGLAASQELAQASQNVETYVADSCQVSLTPVTNVGATTIAPAPSTT
ncbi:MAG: hypothetical protein AB7V43_16725 [Acidimicrobiia bacterium]